MNEQLQKELAAWLEALRSAADVGAAFAIEQAPLIVQEKLVYARVMSLLWITVAIAFIYASIWMWRRAEKWFADPELDHPLGAAQTGALTSLGGYIGSIMFMIFGMVLIFFNVNTLVKSWVAPRLYILEWLNSLV